MYARSFLEGHISEDAARRIFDGKSTGKGLSSYPSPVADAELLAVSHGFDGAGSDPGNLPGTRHEISAKSEAWWIIATGKSGASWATASAMSRNHWARLRWQGARSLGNLHFVINCNLQRLDGPVRGNGKIIQELEGVFRRRRLERDQGDLGP